MYRLPKVAVSDSNRRVGRGSIREGLGFAFGAGGAKPIPRSPPEKASSIGRASCREREQQWLKEGRRQVEVSESNRRVGRGSMREGLGFAVGAGGAKPIPRSPPEKASSKDGAFCV